MHREPDDELLNARFEYVRERIREQYEDLRSHDGVAAETLEEYAERYGAELPQEVEN
jgi:hypothetical protein